MSVRLTEAWLPPSSPVLRLSSARSVLLCSTLLYPVLFDALTVWLYRLWPNPAVHPLCRAQCMRVCVCVCRRGVLLWLLLWTVWYRAHSESLWSIDRLTSHLTNPEIISCPHLPSSHHHDGCVNTLHPLTLSLTPSCSLETWKPESLSGPRSLTLTLDNMIQTLNVSLLSTFKHIKSTPVVKKCAFILIFLHENLLFLFD